MHITAMGTRAAGNMEKKARHNVFTHFKLVAQKEDGRKLHRYKRCEQKWGACENAEEGSDGRRI
jgi:hypothetical protein